MKPIEFKEQTKTLYGRWSVRPLPIFSDGEVCISCWRLRLIERIRALLFGKIWLRLRSGKTQPPVSMICDRKGFIKERK